MRSNFSRRQNNFENEDYWKSFSDLFATTCLVFVFVALVVIITGIRIIDSEKVKYDSLTSELQQEKDELETERDELYAKQDELSKAQEGLDNIAQTRSAIYNSIESTLKAALGDDKVSNDDGRISINSDVMFEPGLAVLSKEGLRDAYAVGDAFFKLLDEVEVSDGNLRIQFIEIRGHTDNRGDGEYNRTLSVNRATNFINAILPKGTVEEARYGKYFKAAGMSKFLPVSGTVELQEGDDTRRPNRRIEIYIQLNGEDIYGEINRLIERGSREAGS